MHQSQSTGVHTEPVGCTRLLNADEATDDDLSIITPDGTTGDADGDGDASDLLLDCTTEVSVGGSDDADLLVARYGKRKISHDRQSINSP